jgi:hypothetical protein
MKLTHSLKAPLVSTLIPWFQLTHSMKAPLVSTLKCDILVSEFAFRLVNFCRYGEAALETQLQLVMQKKLSQTLNLCVVAPSVKIHLPAGALFAGGGGGPPTNSIAHGVGADPDAGAAAGGGSFRPS